MVTEEDRRRDGGRYVWGLVLVVAGVWWFLNEMGLVPFSWGWAGPVALVAVGISMIVQRGRSNCC